MRLLFSILFVLYSITAIADGSTKLNRYLILSDIHFDPLLICESHKPCPILRKLLAAPIQSWHDIFKANTDGSISKAGQDTNVALLHSSLSAATKVCETRGIEWVIINGDSLGHHLHKRFKIFYPSASATTYQQFLAKTFAYLHQEIKSAFQQQQVIMVLGNNDAYTGDYHLVRQGAFLHDFAKLWADQIIVPNSMQKDFPNLGFYSIQPQKDFRIIVLNTTLFAMRYDNARNHENARIQLHWLQQQLQAATVAQQRVWLLMHIPTRVDVYLTPHISLLSLKELWFQREPFDALIKEYAGEIAVIFTGHLHDAWYAFDDANILQISLPAISPIFGTYPAFLSVQVNDQHAVTAINSYSLPIAQHNWRRYRHLLPPYSLGCTRSDAQLGSGNWQFNTNCQI